MVRVVIIVVAAILLTIIGLGTFALVGRSEADEAGWHQQAATV
jgi:hypothetical protein